MKNRAKRWIITYVLLRLSSRLTIPTHPRIADLRADTSSVELRERILGERSRMPSLHTTKYSGSFFLNPHISATKALSLAKKFPELKMRPVGPASYELSAGSVLDILGYRDSRYGPFYFHKENANYVINECDATPAQLAELLLHISTVTSENLHTALVPEPRIIPTFSVRLSDK